VSVVLPVKDDPCGARRVLDATRGLGARIPVDDGSADPLPEATLRHDTPAGPAAARNTGWRRADTELVAFLDADVLPESGWLDALLPLFADPTVAAAAPRIRSRSGDTAVARYEMRRSGLDMGPQPAAVRPTSRVGYVPSAALLVRRAALERTGGFDPRLRFGEDVDLVWRLVGQGHTIRYEPRSVVWHEPRPNLRGWLRQRFDYGTSASPLSARHPRLLACARLSRWSAASWGLLLAGKPAFAVTLMAATAALFPRKLRGRGLPASEALRLATVGHLGAGRVLADAARRTWWPLLLAAAPVSRRARVLGLAALLPCVADSARRGPRQLALRVLDDLAYGAGVWAGCLKERTAAPLLLRFTGDTLR
jgi:mycofactocin system glycosyltransferase